MLGGFPREEAEVAIQEAGGSVFGAVVLVVTVLAKQTDTIARHYLRFDRGGIDPALKRVVDTVYPLRGNTQVIWHPQVPRDL
jgi:hypothetical protein